MTSAKKKDGFESDLEKLEEIVTALEEGGLPLDEALRKFEEGVKLSRKCEKALNEAEKKIEVLTQNAEGELETEPFEEGDDTAVPAPKKRAARKPAEAEEDDEDDTGGEELF